MLNKLFFMLAVSGAIVSCQSQKTTAKTKTTPVKAQQATTKTTGKTETVKDKDIIYLKEGENIFLKDQEMNVTFRRVVEDSRCPEGTNCIWAGAATAEIELMGVATRPRTIRLSTMDDSKKGLAKEAYFNDYIVSLVKLLPNKPASGKDLNGAYQIGLKFAKKSGNATDPTTQRGDATK